MNLFNALSASDWLMLFPYSLRVIAAATSIPEGVSYEDDDFEPIEVLGKPISETILEDRN